MDLPKKVPLGIRLKSTRPSHGRVLSKLHPPEARQSFLLAGLSPNFLAVLEVTKKKRWLLSCALAHMRKPATVRETAKAGAWH